MFHAADFPPPRLPMTLSSTDLAALLCSRLCHDLTNPVGAIGNGFEMLADETDPELRAQYLDLVEQSARTSAVKLQFYRFAFGSPGGLGESVSAEEPRALIEALLADKGQVELEWAVEAPELERTAMKVLLNFAAIGSVALVRGGTLAIGAEKRPGYDGTEAETEIVVRAGGSRIAFDPAIGCAFDGTLEPGEMSAHTAPAVLVRMLADERGGTLQHAVSQDALVMGAVLPAGSAGR